MPTLLEVLLHRRKSAAAGLFQRHVITSARDGSRVRRAGKGWRRWGMLGIIEPSYIDSLTISRVPALAVNGRGILLVQSAAEIPLIPVLFTPRYGKIREEAHVLFNIPVTKRRAGCGAHR